MRDGFRRDIQGLRAVAVLMVVAYHAGLPVPGGYLGVDVFFVISGFLITGLLVDELRSTDRIRFGAFVGRRVRRLLPALAVMTTATVAASHFIVELGRPLFAAASTGVAASLFVANLQLYRSADYFAPRAELNPLLHTWSLSVEEQFYLALPLALMLLWWVFRSSEDRERWLWRGLVVGAVASLGLAVALADLGTPIPGLEDPGRLAFYLPVTRAWEFLAGSLLALHLRRRPSPTEARTRPQIARNVGALGTVAVVGSMFLLTGSAAVPGLVTLPVVGGTVALIWAGSVDDGGHPRRVLDSRIMNWVGDRSYGWYLWHWPLLVLVRAVRPESWSLAAVALLTSLVLAALSYRYVEQPLRRPRSSRSRSLTLAVAAASICVPAFVSSVVARASDDHPSLEVNALKRPSCWGRGTPDEDCRIEVRGGGAPVLMAVGDSHCEALLPGIVLAADELGLDVVVMCRDATPFIAGASGSSAAEAFEYRVEAIGALDPAAVIVVNRPGRNLEPDAWRRWTDEDLRDRSGAVAAWAGVVERTVDALAALAVPVVWVDPVPEHPDALTFTGSRLVAFEPNTIDLVELERQRSDILAVERTVLDRSGAVVRVDPADALCGAVCINGVVGTSYYSDDDHLSPSGAELLAPLLTEAIEAAIGR